MAHKVDLDDALSEVGEILAAHAKPALAALETAETVESHSDLIANLDDAILNLRDALSAAEILRGELS